MVCPFSWPLSEHQVCFLAHLLPLVEATRVEVMANNFVRQLLYAKTRAETTPEEVSNLLEPPASSLVSIVAFLVRARAR